MSNGNTSIPNEATNDGKAIINGVKAIINCRACQQTHPVGSCPLKLAGVEHCNLCGIAHYGHARVCPHVQSETQVRAMLESLKYSNEPEHLVNEARRYLRGVKGNLVQMKKQREAKTHAAREAFAADAYQRPMMASGGFPGSTVYGNNMYSGM